MLVRQPNVHDELNRLRRKTTRKEWTAAEDAVLYRHAERQLPTRPHVENRTASAVKNRMEQLGLAMPTAPFPSAIFDPEAPPLLMHYSTWTI